MYINNKTYIEIHECEKCRNYSICKWVSSMTTMCDGIDKLGKEIEFGCPVDVKVVCKNYERKQFNNAEINVWRSTDRSQY